MEPLMGEIRLFPYTYVPHGWARCQGELRVISQETALFSLIGTEFGGDGRATFALPDLRHASPFGAESRCVGYCIALEGAFPMRD